MHIFKLLNVALSKQTLGGNKTRQLLKLRDTQRGIEVRQAVISRHSIVIKGPAVRLFSSGGEMLDAPITGFIFQQNGSAATSGDDFIAVEAEHSHARTADRRARTLAAQRFGRILNQCQ